MWHIEGAMQTSIYQSNSLVHPQDHCHRTRELEHGPEHVECSLVLLLIVWLIGMLDMNLGLSQEPTKVIPHSLFALVLEDEEKELLQMLRRVEI